MSKKKLEDKTDLELIEELVELKPMPYKAFGMYPIKGTTQHVLVEIAYDPETGDTGAVKELSRDIKEDIIDRLKSQVADNFFRSE